MKFTKTLRVIFEWGFLIFYLVTAYMWVALKKLNVVAFHYFLVALLIYLFINFLGRYFKKNETK